MGANILAFIDVTKLHYTTITPQLRLDGTALRHVFWMFKYPTKSIVTFWFHSVSKVVSWVQTFGNLKSNRVVLQYNFENFETYFQSAKQAYGTARRREFDGFDESGVPGFFFFIMNRVIEYA